MNIISKMGSVFHSKAQKLGNKILNEFLKNEKKWTDFQFYINNIFLFILKFQYLLEMSKQSKEDFKFIQNLMLWGWGS